MTRRIFAKPLDLTQVDAKFHERFWSKVDRRGPDDCWLWTAYRKPPGDYGQIRVGDRYMTASRVVLAMTIGRPLALGEMGCHTCDNPPCCNPAHIFPGDHLVNAMDSISKGRANRSHGESHRDAKLTEAIVREIRSRPDESAATLGRAYGVGKGAIHKIRNGQTWRHVA